MASALDVFPRVRAADGLLEYQVKAAFLLNFTKFIEWPPSAFELPDSPIAICILGEDPFGSSLEQVVSGEVVNQRKVVVRRIKRIPEPKACQVLFWEKPDRDASKALTALGPGVLTVGEGDSFVRDGGIISLVIENRRVQFDVNQQAAESARLKLSSKLLSAARSVTK
jgi:hypothetical protein